MIQKSRAHWFGSPNSASGALLAFMSVIASASDSEPRMAITSDFLQRARWRSNLSMLNRAHGGKRTMASHGQSANAEERRGAIPPPTRHTRAEKMAKLQEANAVTQHAPDSVDADEVHGAADAADQLRVQDVRRRHACRCNTTQIRREDNETGCWNRKAQPAWGNKQPQLHCSEPLVRTREWAWSAAPSQNH